METLQPQLNDRTCPNCGDHFTIGRTDKRFCNDACRIDYNNKIKQARKAAVPKFVKDIGKNLINNYRILKQLNPYGQVMKVPEGKLISLGFNFNLVTSYHTTKKGDTYRYCFDQGYLNLKDGQVLLVVQEIQRSRLEESESEYLSPDQ